MNAFADITAGQTFTTTTDDTFTAVADAKVDTLNALGGYKVEVTEAGSQDSFYLLGGINDMVAAN